MERWYFLTFGKTQEGHFSIFPINEKTNLSISLEICKKVTFPEQNNVVKMIFSYVGKIKKMIFLKHYTQKDDLSNIWKDSGRSLLHLSNHRKDHLSRPLEIRKKLTFPRLSTSFYAFPTIGKTYFRPVIQNKVNAYNSLQAIIKCRQVQLTK